jgi:hypothetical protein
MSMFWPAPWLTTMALRFSTMTFRILYEAVTFAGINP